MNGIYHCFALTVAVVCFASASGCSNKYSPETGSQAFVVAEKLPGGTNVTAALQQKNYERVLISLGQVQRSISTEEQRMQFALLASEVKNRLMEASEKDPKAAEALSALRVMTTRR